MNQVRELNSYERGTLERFYEDNSLHFPFDDKNVELIVLEDEYTPKYIENSKLFKVFRENRENEENEENVVIEARYFPMYWENVDYTLNISSLDFDRMISFLRRFDYWECDIDWLIEQSREYFNELLRIFCRYRYIIKKRYFDTIGILKYLITYITTNFSYKSFNDITNIIVIRTTLFDCDFDSTNILDALINNPTYIDKLRRQKEIFNKYDSLYQDSDLLRCFFDFFEYYVSSLQSSFPYVNEYFYEKYSFKSQDDDLDELDDLGIYDEKFYELSEKVISRFGIDFKIDSGFGLVYENSICENGVFIVPSNKHTLAEHFILKFMQGNRFFKEITDNDGLITILNSIGNSNNVRQYIDFIFDKLIHVEYTEDCFYETPTISFFLKKIVHNRVDLMNYLNEKYDWDNIIPIYWEEHETIDYENDGMKNLLSDFKYNFNLQ